ncbi:membrane-associated oxidoreductase [Pseudomonas syringae]|nr:membrane-associated oxidoreductase [Pseudomonas syringae]
MEGSDGKALTAEGIVCGANICLSNGFVANGRVSLAGAQITGQLNCEGAEFSAHQGIALLADRIIVRHSVYLSDGFSANACVRLVGARIYGELRCSGGTFDGSKKDDVLRMDDAVISESVSLDFGFKASGRVNLQNVQVGGDLVIDDAKCIDTLDANRINIKGALILRGLEESPKSVTFAGGRAGSLDDDKKSWGKTLDLNGFVYGFINFHAEMSIADRLEWLDKQYTPVSEEHGAKEFRPQPWRHLQSVLDEMGHAEEARQVGIEFEKRLRAAGLIGQGPKRWKPLRRWFYKNLMTFLHVMYGFLTGYGYRPMLLLRSFVVVWLVCSGIYWLAANEGAIFAPSDPLVFQNEKYASCVPPASPTGQEPLGTGNWYLCAELPEAYTGFSPLAFSLDLLLPLVDLHQEKDWAPLIETPKANIFAELWGFFSAKRLVRFVMWVEILAGWGFSLLFVAVVSGLARRKE